MSPEELEKQTAILRARAWSGDHEFERPIKDDEIILEDDTCISDADREEWLKQTKEKLGSDYSYSVYGHGGRCPHLHIENIDGLAEMNYETRKAYKEVFILKYAGRSADTKLARKHLIPTPGAKVHWKKYLGFEDAQHYTEKKLIEKINKDTKNKIDNQIIKKLPKSNNKSKEQYKEFSDGLIKELQDLGYEINSNQMIRCPNPDHEDKNPSCKLYDNNSYHCFSCKTNGKITDLINKKISHPHTPTSTQSHPHTPSSTQKEKDYEIKALLSKKRPNTKQRKSGIHNNLFYFGTVVGAKRTNAIVTSDKKIFIEWEDKEKPNEIKVDLGLDCRYDFEQVVLDSHWSQDSINAYLFGNKKVLKLADVYNSLLTNNKKFMYYPEDTTHKVVALDVLATYFLPCFEAMGRTFIEAEKGSGKTRQCTLYKLQACNSIMSSDISASSFFRLMESTCSTLVIDDFDSLTDEQKMSILQHYKTGYKATSKSVRTGDNKKRSIDAFHTYGHVVMNNTQGIDDISADRSKYLPILKVDGDITVVNINESDKCWQDVVDDCFTAALNHWLKVKYAYDNCSSDKLSARKFEVTRPILALASLISSELMLEVENYFVKNFEQFSGVDVENDWSYLAYSHFFDKKTGYSVLLKTISEEIVCREMSPTDHKYKSKIRGVSTFLGKMFTNSPLFRKKKVHGCNHIELTDIKKLGDYVRAVGWNWVELGGTGNGVAIFEKDKKSLRDKIFDYVNSQTEPISIDVLVTAFGVETEKVIEVLCSEGVLYIPKTGFVAVLK